MNAIAESRPLFGGGGAVMLAEVVRTALPQGRGVVVRLIGAIRERFIRERLQSSAEERKVRRAVRRLSGTVGASLLTTGSVDDFQAAIDDALSKTEVFEVISQASKLATFRAVEAASKRDMTPEPEIVEVLGANAAATFQRGMVYAAVGASEALRFAVKHIGGEAELTRLIDSFSVSDPMAFLHDHSIPLPVREALLNSLRTLPVVFAFGRAMSLRQPLKPWLAEAIAGTFAQGQLAYLRIVATLPGAAIPESLLPKADRLDAAAIAREHAERERRYKAALDQARASEQDVYRV